MVTLQKLHETFSRMLATADSEPIYGDSLTFNAKSAILKEVRYKYVSMD
jgi:hypothetical protein